MATKPLPPEVPEPAAADTQAPAPTPNAPDATPIHLADYRPVTPQRVRHDGWTAERQRTFLTVLAETGLVSEASIQAGVSARSAYRLRQKPHAKAFADAWDHALRLATLRLTTVAFERAIKGTVKEYWKEDQLVAQTRTPSDRLLVFLLGHLLPKADGVSRLDHFDKSMGDLAGAFPATLARLTDDDADMVPIESRDFFAEVPGDSREDW